MGNPIRAFTPPLGATQTGIGKSPSPVQRIDPHTGASILYVPAVYGGIMPMPLPLPWPGYQNRFAVDPRIMNHPAAMAYNLNLLQAQNRGSPIPYTGVAHPSPLGIGQPSPDKEVQEPIRNGKLESCPKAEQSRLHTPERKSTDMKDKQGDLDNSQNRSLDSQTDGHVFHNALLHRKDPTTAQRPVNFHLAPPNANFPSHPTSGRPYPPQYLSRLPYRVQHPNLGQPSQQQQQQQLSPAYTSGGHSTSFFSGPIAHRSVQSPTMDGSETGAAEDIRTSMGHVGGHHPNLSQHNRVNSFGEDGQDGGHGDGIDIQGSISLEALSQQQQAARLGQWGEAGPFLQNSVAFPVPQQLAHLTQPGMARLPPHLLRAASWGIGSNATEDETLPPATTGPPFNRYPGLLREMPPQEQPNSREVPDMQPPPQSRLLQYRQSRGSGDPSSHLGPASNHMFPSGPYPPDTVRNHLGDPMLTNPALQQHQVNHLYNSDNFPHQSQTQSASPPPSQVRYPMQEPQWPHGAAAPEGPPQQNNILSHHAHGLPYGVSMMAHASRQEQVHMMHLHQQQQQSHSPEQESYHPMSPRTSAPTALHSVDEYEPRGPGRPLYQRRISSTYPDDSPSCNNNSSSLSQQPQPGPRDHPHAHVPHHQLPHGPYPYPSHESWPANGGAPGPFQNVPCNGAATLQHRELLAAKGHRPSEEQVKAEAQTHPHLGSLQHLGQFPPLMSNNKPPPPQPPTEAGQGNPSLNKPPTMSYASALRAPPKPRAARPEQAKKNSDPLSLLQELSIRGSNSSNGYYSYFPMSSECHLPAPNK